MGIPLFHFTFPLLQKNVFKVHILISVEVLQMFIEIMILSVSLCSIIMILPKHLRVI